MLLKLELTIPHRLDKWQIRKCKGLSSMNSRLQSYRVFDYVGFADTSSDVFGDENEFEYLITVGEKTEDRKGYQIR